MCCYKHYVIHLGKDIYRIYMLSHSLAESYQKLKPEESSHDGNPDQWRNYSWEGKCDCKESLFKSFKCLLVCVCVCARARAQVDWVRNHMEQAIPVKDVFQMNEVIDVVAVTKGKGFKGEMFHQQVYKWSYTFKKPFFLLFKDGQIFTVYI